MQTVVIQMSEQKFMELLLKAAIKVIQNQGEEIEKLKLERKIQNSVISGLEENAETLRETIGGFVETNVELEERLESIEYLADANDRTNGAFLSILRAKLNEGVSRAEVISKITQFLEA